MIAFAVNPLIYGGRWCTSRSIDRTPMRMQRCRALYGVQGVCDVLAQRIITRMGGSPGQGDDWWSLRGRGIGDDPQPVSETSDGCSGVPGAQATGAGSATPMRPC